MVTFHPMAKKVAGGYRPMVVMRNAKGQCIGSKVAGARTYTGDHRARMHALFASHKAMHTLTLAGYEVRVA